MNWDQIEGQWKQAKGVVKQKWAKLTDSDLDFISGKKDQLLGRLQERYGISKEDAMKEVEDWDYPSTEPRRAETSSHGSGDRKAS
jgi:uncharacterized protein YjbJ (UPF0337 family)